MEECLKKSKKRNFLLTLIIFTASMTMVSGEYLIEQKAA